MFRSTIKYFFFFFSTISTIHFTTFEQRIRVHVYKYIGYFIMDERNGAVVHDSKIETCVSIYFKTRTSRLINYSNINFACFGLPAIFLNEQTLRFDEKLGDERGEGAHLALSPKLVVETERGPSINRSLSNRSAG